MTLQATLDEAGTPLSAATFVVVDLETTGGSHGRDSITEIGAVKIRGGETIGEFATLVNPGSAIPPMIVALTGITDAMVAQAPRIEQVLPSFLEFLGDAALIAHNAKFDVSFLKAACARHEYDWPRPRVFDTVTMARRCVSKDEAPNRKLGTLARVFGTEVTPNHRALEDARATAEIFHAMLGRLAGFGITHVPDLVDLGNAVPDSIRAKSTLADAVPSRPGVYVFRAGDGERLYVGVSRNMHSRVKSYFTKGEQRRLIRPMLEVAASVESIVCPTDLEARVREVRAIARWRPRYNRRSTRPEATPWLRLTEERHSRWAMTRSATTLPDALGPFASLSQARAAQELLSDAAGLRTCTARLPIAPRPGAHACLAKDLGTCAAPCVRGATDEYEEAIASARTVLDGSVDAVLQAAERRIADLAEASKYEEAASVRDAAASVVDAAFRRQRHAALLDCSLVAVRRIDSAWDIVSIHRGALVASERVTTGVWAAAHRLRDSWQVPEVDARSATGPIVEEIELILAWLESDGVRLLHIDGEWTSPLGGPGAHRRWIDARRRAREGALPRGD